MRLTWSRRRTRRVLALLPAAGLLLAVGCAQPALQTSTPAPAAVPSGAVVTPMQAPSAAPTVASATTSAPVANLSGEVKADGSSTVFPISEAVGEEFQKANANVRVTIGISGTGGGFKKFCSKETDVSNASRPIKQEEAESCARNGIEFVELPVAYDGLSVMVNASNTFIDCIKVSELKKIWEPDAQAKITKWNQVNPSWPDRTLALYGPGTDSGTFDYFTTAINGKEKASRGDYTASEDDNVLVQGIAGDPGALGYFGFAYYEENADKLKLLKVDNEKGAGCVAPALETIEKGTYQPLSRPIFIYVSKASLARQEVKAFIDFYLKSAPKLVGEVGYVPLPDSIYALAQRRADAQKVGSIFAGGSQVGVTLEDLLSGEQ